MVGHVCPGHTAVVRRGRSLARQLIVPAFFLSIVGCGTAIHENDSGSGPQDDALELASIDPIARLRARLETRGLQFEEVDGHWVNGGVDISVAHMRWRASGSRQRPGSLGENTAPEPLGDVLLEVLEQWRKLPIHGSSPQRAALERLDELWPKLVRRLMISRLSIELPGSKVELTGSEFVIDRETHEDTVAWHVRGEWRVGIAGVDLRGDLDLSMELAAERMKLSLGGHLEDGPQFGFDLEDDSAVSLALRSRQGRAEVRLDAAEEGPRLHVVARDMPLAWLGPLRVGRGRDGWFGSILSQGRFAGELKIQFSGHSFSIETPRLVFSQLGFHSPRIARGLVEFPLELTDCNYQHDPTEQQLQGKWQLAGLQGAVNIEFGSRLAKGVVHVEQARCQAWLDSIPRALIPHMGGVRWQGRSAARIAWRVDLEQLDSLRQRLEAARKLGREPRWMAPGRLDVDLPLLSRCRVIEEAAIADLDALANGTYRHRMIDAQGAWRELDLPRRRPLTQLGVHRIADAFVGLEDTKFWRHDGFDREQLQRAFWRNLALGTVVGGASTITQQTARNLWLGGEQTISRKLEEAYFASRLEARLDKRRILQIYLAIIELDAGIHGVEAASLHYFGRPLLQLGAVELLHLASLAPAPLTYSARFENGEVDEHWKDALVRHRQRVARRARVSAGAWWRARSPENEALQLRRRRPDGPLEGE